MQKAFVAMVGGLVLGQYTFRENAGRRLLKYRRNTPGRWKKLSEGCWRNQETGVITRIRTERCRIG